MVRGRDGRSGIEPEDTPRPICAAVDLRRGVCRGPAYNWVIHPAPRLSAQEHVRMTLNSEQLDRLAVDTIRTLAIHGV